MPWTGIGLIVTPTRPLATLGLRWSRHGRHNVRDVGLGRRDHEIRDTDTSQRLESLRHFSRAVRSTVTNMNRITTLRIKNPIINENTRTRTTDSGNHLAIRTSESYTPIGEQLNKSRW